MRRGKINMLLDGQWGSSGKGKWSPWLAERYGVRYASSSNGPNAGHTYQRGSVKHVFKCLPAAVMADSVESVLLSAASVFDQERMATELLTRAAQVFVHERSTVLRPEHSAAERVDERTRSIASTMQGTGAAKVDKIMRRADVIAREALHPNLRQIVTTLTPVESQDMIEARLDAQEAWLHEISQGYALSIDHGSHFPQCTSRNCSVGSAIDDLGIGHRRVGDVYINVRPYPIRVGNFEEDGEVIGLSGDGYHDCHEVTWQHVAHLAGMPHDEAAALLSAERTTVTKRLRRVFTFSRHGFALACRANSVTHVLLNFAQYLDWSIRGERGERSIGDLPVRIRDFVLMLQEISNCPVVAIGTGADHDDVIVLK